MLLPLIIVVDFFDSATAQQRDKELILCLAQHHTYCSRLDLPALHGSARDNSLTISPVRLINQLMTFLLNNINKNKTWKTYKDMQHNHEDRGSRQLPPGQKNNSTFVQRFSLTFKHRKCIHISYRIKGYGQ